MSDVTYKLEELARAAGTSARTVRYYVQRGLLPAPAFRGKDTAYGQEHLVRLRAIRRLQDAFFPLDAVAAELEGRSSIALERIAEGTELPTRGSLSLPPPEMATPRQIADAKPSASGARIFRRIEIAPGVELSVAEDAPVESRTLADKILKQLGEETK